MFTNYVRTAGRLQPIKRETENTDTRQEILRHDPDEQRRKNARKNDDQSAYAEDDFTGVSVESLRAFLVAFIEDIHEEPKKGEKSYEVFEEEKAHEREEEHNQPQSPQAAQAYEAYSNAASAYSHTMHSHNVKDAEATAKNLGLSVDEVRSIYTLIEDLDTLQERGVQYLRIERGTSFLNSIENAVAAIKLGL